MYHDEPPGFEIVELETELQEMRGQREDANNTIFSRTAAVQQRNKDVDRFLRHGWAPEDISENLRVPMVVIKARIAKLEEESNDGRSQLERELAILEGTDF